MTKFNPIEFFLVISFCALSLGHWVFPDQFPDWVVGMSALVNGVYYITKAFQEIRAS